MRSLQLREACLEAKGREALVAREAFWVNDASYFAFRDYIRYQKRQAAERLARQDEGGSEKSYQRSDSIRSTASSSHVSTSGWSERTTEGARGGALPGEGVSSPFTFVGMHAIFEAPAEVTALVFARPPSDSLSYGTAEGSIHVAHGGSTPSVSFCLEGHTKAITHLEWSMDNQYLVSCSQDKSLRIWEVSSHQCLRIVYGDDPVACAVFHPTNNNLLLAGYVSGWLHAVNFSTGKVVSKRPFKSAIVGMAPDASGGMLYVLEAAGWLHALSCERAAGATAPLSALALPPPARGKDAAEGGAGFAPLSCLSFKSYCPALKGPGLLAGRGNGSLYLIAAGGGHPGAAGAAMELRSQVETGAPAARSIRSVLCPLVSVDQTGEFVAAGGEDTSVYILDVLRVGRHPGVNRLQGHLAPVVGTAWNGAGTVLASSDAGGVVILWKRAG